MSEISLYGFEDADGTPDTFTTQDLAEARERAAKYGLRLIAHTYEWTESEMIEDHTS